jgi:hypothetical protein
MSRKGWSIDAAKGGGVHAVMRVALSDLFESSDGSA